MPIAATDSDKGQQVDTKEVAAAARAGQRQATRPVPQAVHEVDQMVGFQSIDPRPVEEDTPVFRGYVVYLGNQRNHSVSLSGRIAAETFEDPDGDQVMLDREGRPLLDEDGKERKQVVLKSVILGEGVQCYDFASHDIRGQRVRNPYRIVSATSRLEHLRLRPMNLVEHPEHLREFLKRRGPDGAHLYHVTIAPEHVPAFQSYVARKSRIEVSVRSELDHTVTQEAGTQGGFAHANVTRPVAASA